ncbi:MAG: NADH-quinone oxidoreductase subunit L, partial [Planctomycetes bacterium]|nr:NADH-quinone oxidoreductase subunit L [Planctomycetota bacterium]
THAGFKALLFLIAATIFHSFSHEQKIYKFGGLNKVAVLSFTLLLLSLMSLIGIPFYSGFYSKDFILRCSFNSYVWSEF